MVAGDASPAGRATVRYGSPSSGAGRPTRPSPSGQETSSTTEDAGTGCSGNDLFHRCKKYEDQAIRRQRHIEELQDILTRKNQEIARLREQVNNLFDQKVELLKIVNQTVFPVRPFPSVVMGKEQALKPLEEAAEAFGAWQNHAVTGEECYREQVVSECADTIQAAVNLAASMGCDDMTKPMRECRRRIHARGRC